MPDNAATGMLYCAVAILCAAMLFFYAHQIAELAPRRSITRFAYYAYISAGAAALFDCAYGLRESGLLAFTESASFFFTLCYTILVTLNGLFWVCYSEKTQNSWFSTSKKRFALMLIPFFGMLAVMLSTPFTGWYFYFNGKSYSRGPLFFVLAGVSVFYIFHTGLTAYVRSMKKENYIKRNEYKMFFLFALTIILIQIIQLTAPPIFPYRSFGMLLIYSLLITVNLRELIRTDTLTHLNNRYAMERFLAQRMHSGEDFELGILDVDDFKRINDSYGHPVGDAALQYVSEALKKSVPGSYFICRNGGDEFMIVGSRNENVLPVIEEKINGKLEELLAADGRTYRVTVSVGWCLKTAGTNNIPDLIAAADKDLYRRKQEKKLKR